MEKEIVLITGANGLIATHTAKTLVNNNYEVRFLTRSPKQSNEYRWDPMNKEIDEKALEGVSYIVHLSGAPFYDGTPLTEERKKLVWGTRIGASELLLEKLKKKDIKLKAFVSASALGFYAFTDKTIAIDESGNRANTYEGELIEDWEKAADQFKTSNIADRVVKLRICLVLDPQGKLFLNFKNQLAVKPETFKNSTETSYFPWVHADDMGRMFAYAVINNTLEGVFNTTAPDVTTKQSIFKLMYYASLEDMKSFNEVDTTFNGQHLTSDKIIQTGYVFRFPDIKSAIQNLIK